MRNIRGIFLAGVLLIAPVVSIAAEIKGKASVAKPAKKSKMGTLSQLIKFAEENGKDKKLNENEVEDLGFESQLATKKLGKKLSPMPNLHERYFQIVYDKSLKPIALFWCDAKSHIDQGREVDSLWFYRSSLSGELEKCAHGVADGDDVSQSVVEIDEDVKKSFNEIVSYFLKEMVERKSNFKK